MAALSNWLAGLLGREMHNSWKPFVGRTLAAIVGFGAVDAIYHLVK